MRVKRTTILIAAGLLAAGCGNKPGEEPQAATESPETSDAPADQADGQMLEACHLKMKAPEAKEWTTYWDPRAKRALGEGPSLAHSTYWANDEERKSLASSKAPVLEITCTAEDENHDPVLGLNLSSVELTEQEIPLGPGTYQIVERPLQEGQAPNKGIYVAPLIYGGSVFWEAKSGSLKITRFDTQGIAGSFAFEGQERMTGQRPISIEGTFDIPCRGGILEGACTANKAVND